MNPLRQLAWLHPPPEQTPSKTDCVILGISGKARTKATGIPNFDSSQGFQTRGSATAGCAWVKGEAQTCWASCQHWPRLEPALHACLGTDHKEPLADVPGNGRRKIKNTLLLLCHHQELDFADGDFLRFGSMGQGRHIAVSSQIPRYCGSISAA